MGYPIRRNVHFGKKRADLVVTALKESTLVGKSVARVLYVVLLGLGPAAVIAKPALAVMKLGGSHLSHLALSAEGVESAALVASGIGFLALASAVRRWQPSVD